MPLLKLWNALRGQPSTTTPAESGTGQTTPAAPAPLARHRFSLGRGPHGTLCKLARQAQPKSVLEISVGDGSRALALLKALESTTDPIRYAAIDQFELAGSPLTLKQFHRVLRGQQVRSARLFPEAIGEGLVRVASTIGAVDLVLIAVPAERWQTPTILPRLMRVTHAESQVLYLEGETWNRWEPVPTCHRRAA
jgi:hypothetical protein